MQKWDGIRFFKLVLFTFFVLSINFLSAQISEGRILFERRTNLEKKFKDSPYGKKAINKDNKIKVENFELFFTDSSSIFKPILSDEVDRLSWATAKNTVFHNLNTSEKLIFLNVWGKELIVKDSIGNRNWKITESSRSIAGYKCYKSIWQKDDTTRIYAWFTPEIIPSIGPEGFDGLPGTILGLATEDGGIIYFAKEVKIMTPKEEDLAIDLKKKDIFTKQTLSEKFEKQYGTNDFGKRIFAELFRWL